MKYSAKKLFTYNIFYQRVNAQKRVMYKILDFQVFRNKLFVVFNNFFFLHFMNEF